MEGLRPPTMQDNIFDRQEDHRRTAARLNLVYAAQAEQKLREVEQYAAEAIGEAEKEKQKALEIASEANEYARRAHLAREREASVQVWSLGAGGTEDAPKEGNCPAALYDVLQGNTRRKRSSQSWSPLDTC